MATTVTDEEAVQTLKASLRGEVVLPDDLAALGARCDPANFFRLNQNIKPA